VAPVRMHMSKSYFPGLMATLALAIGGTATAQTTAQSVPTPQVSPALAKTFKAAQDAQKAKQWPELIAKAQEVLASSGRKPDDTYYAYYLLFDANKNLGNVAEMRKNLEGVVDSGFLTPPQQATFLKALVSLAFQAKDYDAAIDYGLRMVKADTADVEVQTYIGQSYYQKGAFTDSARLFNDLVNEQIKQGQTPREQHLQLLQSSYSKLSNKNAETDALEKLVTYYPKPLYWEHLLFSVRSNPALDARQKLWVYRLMWATGTLKPVDYNRFAEYAQGAGLPAEAQKVYEAGLKANAFPDEEKPRIERQTVALGKVTATDMAELSKLEAEAKAASTGDLDVVLGMTLNSYGETAKAIEVLQRGLQKGGLKEQQAIDGAMGLGMAQLRVKDNAAAQKTFESIKTADADMQRVVKLWLLYAK
jgi:hypothetical protein